MSDAYWRYAESQQHAPSSITGKRPRPDYDVSGVHDLASYFPQDGDRGRVQVIRDTESLDASYERYLRNAVSSYGPGQPTRTIDGGVPSHSIVDSHVTSIGGVDRRTNVNDKILELSGGRSDHSLPPGATNTLFVEGLPSNCSRREVAHIFRPFVGYKEVRLVSKESRQPGGDPLLLCFVDFVSPAHAATAMDALHGYILQVFFVLPNGQRQRHSSNGEWRLTEDAFQVYYVLSRGYKFDELDRSSVNLRFQFARNPGRSGGGHRGKR